MSFKPLPGLLGVLLIGMSLMAQAEGFVICNPAVQIAAPELKEVFTGEKLFAGGIKLSPVDNASAQASFLASFLKMDVIRYNTVWTKKSFREGINPPPVKAGDNEVLAFVRKTPGAVGYVSSEPSGVTVIQKF